MRLSILTCVVLMAVYLGPADAWWSGGGGGGSSRKEKSFADRVVDKARKVKDFATGAVKGAGSMGKAYNDMRDANWKNSDKYFHARGNSDAAKHGAGGKWAAKTISNAREWVDRNIKGDSAASSNADQKANKWGRNGGDPNKYRPKGLPKKF